MIVALCTCAAPTCTDAKTVVDGDGNPLAGVHVIAVWDAEINQVVQSSHTCFKLDATETNEHGAYFVSQLSGNINPFLLDRTRLLLYYKEGYRNLKDGPVIPFITRFIDRSDLDDLDADPHVMVRDPSVGVERIRYITYIAAGTECGSEAERRSYALPILKAMHAEAEANAKERTASELKLLDGLQLKIDTLELGDRPALERARERTRQVKLKERTEALKRKPDAEIGMTAKQVSENTRWGQPLGIDRLNRSFSHGSERWDERWTYAGERFLYFDNGRLMAMQENGQLTGGPLTKRKDPLDGVAP